MSTPGKVAVQATKKDFYGLRHVCGDTLDESGRGEWPEDAFTFRLRDEKAIRLIEDDPNAPADKPAKASGSSKE